MGIVARVKPRLVRPELLDDMDPNDPAASHSRADLRRLNWLMANAHWIDRALRREKVQARAVAELGAGDGTFLLSVVRKLKKRGVQIEKAVALDRQSIVSQETRAGFAALGCAFESAQADVFDANKSLPKTDIIICNLFLHHFVDDQLRQLFARIEENCDCFVACETRRYRAAPYTTPLLGLIGCNYVTRHDAKLSVEAGFWDGELTKLWPNQTTWKFREEPAGTFSHLFMAKRNC